MNDLGQESTKVGEEGFPVLPEYRTWTFASVVEFVKIHVHPKVPELVKEILINMTK